MNSNLTLFRTLDKFAFHAHQKALRNHKAICQNNLCDICTYVAKVADYTWDLKNYARYLTPMVNKLQPETLKQKKTVKFSNSDVREKIQKGPEFERSLCSARLYLQRVFKRDKTVYLLNVIGTSSNIQFLKSLHQIRQDYQVTDFTESKLIFLKELLQIVV